MSEQRRKTATLKLRIDPALSDAAERAASEEHCSTTTLIEKLLDEYLRAKGYVAEASRAGRIAQGAADAKDMANSAIDKALRHSTESASVRRKLRRALTEMPARVVAKE